MLVSTVGGGQTRRVSGGQAGAVLRPQSVLLATYRILGGLELVIGWGLVVSGIIKGGHSVSGVFWLVCVFFLGSGAEAQNHRVVGK